MADLIAREDVRLAEKVEAVIASLKDQLPLTKEGPALMVEEPGGAFADVAAPTLSAIANLLYLASPGLDAKQLAAGLTAAQLESCHAVRAALTTTAAEQGVNAPRSAAWQLLNDVLQKGLGGARGRSFEPERGRCLCASDRARVPRDRAPSL